MKNDEFEDELNKALDLYSKGRLSSEKKAQLDKELDEMNLNNQFEFTVHDLDQGWKKLDVKTRVSAPAKSRNWIPIAAAVVITAAAALLTIWWNRDNSNSSDKLILADGSIVWLKNDAELDYSKLSPTNREVILTGEALFEVAKDREHPFIIHCGQYEARVLGTSFNIKSTDSTVELTVLTGHVRLSSIKTDSSVIVQSREHVVLTSRITTLKKMETGNEELISITENTQYNMRFEDTRMDEIVKRIEGKFDVSVELNEGDLRNCMISADFTDQSLITTLTMISEALGTQYEVDGDNIMISGVGCKE